MSLAAPNGDGPDFLVVDVPPSEMAPHFMYGWEQKDKDRLAFNAPYRVRDKTDYMGEHLIARAYQERFARQSAADVQLKARLAEAAETVLGESEDHHAWLVIASLLTRPVPRLVPAPTRSEAADILRQAVAAAARIRGDFGSAPVVREFMAGDFRVGLRRWVESTFLIPEYRTSRRGVMVELHHDGSVVVCADLSTRLEADSGIPVNTAACQGALTLAGCQATLTDMGAEDTPASLAGQVTDKNPEIGLQAVVALRRLLEELERVHVDNARNQGWSWQSIATSLNVSRQSVHEKHASRRKAEGKEK